MPGSLAGEDPRGLSLQDRDSRKVGKYVLNDASAALEERCRCIGLQLGGPTRAAATNEFSDRQ